MNLCTVPLGTNGVVSFGGAHVHVAAAQDGRPAIVLGLRPESLELSADGLSAHVEVVEEVGADAFVFCVAEVGGKTTKLVARTAAQLAPERGERVTLRAKGDEALFFDPESGERLTS
jgi:multiple sugar transport system ATP-binding protein